MNKVLISIGTGFAVGALQMGTGMLLTLRGKDNVKESNNLLNKFQKDSKASKLLAALNASESDEE